jgi:hypothetical protein
MKLPILEQGKIVGFYSKETPAEKAAGKRVFALVQLEPGITREDIERMRAVPSGSRHIERMRAKWPISGEELCPPEL